jgi:hypothetical protein
LENIKGAELENSNLSLVQDLMSTDEACNFLGISAPTFRKLVDEQHWVAIERPKEDGTTGGKAQKFYDRGVLSQWKGLSIGKK